MIKDHKKLPNYLCYENIGGKWKPAIFMRLSQGVNRFRILSRSIDGISKNILIREFRELEAHKIINRKIFAEIPPRVEYSLTEKGLTLLPVFDKLNEWGSMHLND